jgi:hypothetical protein
MKAIKNIKSTVFNILIIWLFVALTVRLEQSWGNSYTHTFILLEVVEERDKNKLFEIKSLREIDNFNFLGNPHINAVYVKDEKLKKGDIITGILEPKECASWFDFFMMFGNSYNYELIEALEIK